MSLFFAFHFWNLSAAQPVHLPRSQWGGERGAPFSVSGLAKLIERAGQLNRPPRDTTGPETSVLPLRPRFNAPCPPSPGADILNGQIAGPVASSKRLGQCFYRGELRADFQEWRDQRDWTAEKYRRFDRREPKTPKLPRRKTRNCGCRCGRILCPNPAAGNGIFGCGDRPPNIAAKMGERSQRQKSGK